MIAPQHSTQDSPPDDLLAKLGKRPEDRWREITEESAIDPAVALERGYYLEETKRGLERLGFTRRQQRAPAIVIPRFSPSGERIPAQIKSDNPLVEERNGKSRPRKYETPAGKPVRLSVPPRAVPMMRDVQKSLYVTEGDKKADSLASNGEVAISLQGVACWRVLGDWEHVSLVGRVVNIAFDADVMANPSVQREMEKLAEFLFDRGAVVRYLNWPERYRGTKTGVDDYLAAGGTIQELQGWLVEHPNEDDLPVGTLLSEVEEEKIDWLWERRIPYRKLTMLDGDPAHGKSVIVAELAARVTTGRGMPLHTGKVEAGGVLLLAAEDGVADTILPRILAAGGDPSRVLVLGHDTPLWIPEDMHTVERGAERIGAKLIAVDPIMSFLGAGINSNTDKEVRTALSPLKHLAERIGAAVLIVRHLNKQQGGSAMYRGAGSIAFSGAARQGLMVDDHPREEGMKVLVGYKSNLSLPPDTMKYKVVSAPSNPDVAAVEFHGIDTEVSSGDIARPKPSTEDRSAMAEAIDFLRETLAGGPVAAKKVEKEAEDAGHSWATVKRAKDALKVKSEKDGTVWMWRLPEDPGDDPGDGGNRAGASVRQCDTPIDEHLEHLQETGVATDGCVGKVLIDEHLEHLPPNTPYNNNNNGSKEAYISEGAQGAQDAHDPPTHRRTDAQKPVTKCSNEDAHPPTPDEQLERLTKNDNGLGMGNGQVAQDAHPVEQLDYMPVFTPANLADLVEEISHTTGPIALDTETFDPTGEDRALDVRRAGVRLLQLAVGESAPYVVDARTAGDMGPLLEALADRPVVVHNAAYDLAVLRTNYGYVHRGSVFDTFLAAKVFYAGTNNRAGLEDLLAGLLEVEIDKTNQDSDWGAELSPAQLEYAARDVLYLHELADVLRARTGKTGMADVVELENRMVKVTAEMTALGMPVDEAVFAECVRQSVESVEKSVAALDALVTEPLPEKFAKANAKNKNTPIERVHRVNWNSTAQVLWALQTAGLKLRSTDKQTRAKHEGHPMVDALSALRDGGDIARRFKETEVADGRVHATWKQVEAATGRMSCENPPLQGISRPLRRAFVAPEGHALVVSDLSQIEVRVLCAISGDDNLRQEFIEGADVHTAVAANVLGVTREEVTPEQRKLAKSLVFGLLYGQGLKGFASKAREVFKKDYTEKDVERLFWRPFFGAYPGVARWRQETINRFKRGRRDSYTTLGRRRLGLMSDRQALNAPIQGGAADVMKAIAVAVYERRLEIPGLEIVGLIHDEILATVPEEHAAAAAELVHELMKEVGEEVTNLGVEEDKRVPVDAETKVCDCWAQKD